jgi:hypothetical protein
VAATRWLVLCRTACNAARSSSQKQLVEQVVEMRTSGCDVCGVWCAGVLTTFKVCTLVRCPSGAPSFRAAWLHANRKIDTDAPQGQLNRDSCVCDAAHTGHAHVLLHRLAMGCRNQGSSVCTGSLHSRGDWRCLGRVWQLVLALAVLQPCPTQALSAQIHGMDFCQPDSWIAACELQTRAHRRHDIYCARRLEPLRQALVQYCTRHQAALQDIAANGNAAARKYKYVAAEYTHQSGLGNRLPGMVSAFYLALMTGAQAG